jgi:hypothetical protein
MPDNISRLIEVGDDRVEWIKRLLSICDEETNTKDIKIQSDIIVEETKLEIAKTVSLDDIPRLNVKPVERIERWKIYILGSSSAMNIKCYIYANIWGEPLCVWETDSYHYVNGKKMWTFLWKKWTMLEWLKKWIQAKTGEELASQFEEWILEELSKRYPDDYKNIIKEEEKYSWITLSWTSFDYFLDFWKNRFICEFSIRWQKYTLTPTVEKKGKNNVAKIDARAKWWISWNQFWNLVVWKNSELLSSIWKMIEEFIKILEWNHSWIKKNWNVGDFQSIAESYQNLDS